MIDRPMAASAVWSRNGSARPSGFTATRLGILAAPTRQVPRHARCDFAAQERFKFRARMEELAREEPGRSVQVFDEHRAGLKPVIRRVSRPAPAGARPSPI